MIDLRKKFKEIPLISRILTRSTLNNASKNLGWLIFDRAIKILAGLFVGAWVTRYLGPDRFGTYSYIIAFVAIVTPISRLGLTNIVIRNLVNQPQNEGEILGTTFILQFIASLAAIGISILYTLLTSEDNPQSLIYISILSSVLLFHSLREPLDCLYQSKIEAKYNVWSRVLAIFLVSCFRIVLILIKASLVYFIWATLLEIVLVSLFLANFFKRNGGQFHMWKASISQARLLLRDSWPLLISSIATIIYMKIDQLMLGNMTGKSELGLYSAAVQLSEMWFFIPMAIGTTVFPMMLNSQKVHSKDEYNSRVQLYFDIIAFIALVIMVFIVLVGPWIVNVLYGVEYARTSLILRVHIWSFIFVSLGIMQNRWLLAENFVKYSMISTIIGAIINIGINLWLIPMYSGIGAAWGSVISYGITLIILPILAPKLRALFKMQILALLAPFRIPSIIRSFQKNLIHGHDV